MDHVRWGRLLRKVIIYQTLVVIKIKEQLPFSHPTGNRLRPREIPISI